jgi:hypothetical protein
MEGLQGIIVGGMVFYTLQFMSTHISISKRDLIDHYLAEPLEAFCRRFKESGDYVIYIPLPEKLRNFILFLVKLRISYKVDFSMAVVIS